MRCVLAAHAARRIAAQRHDMADAGIPVGARDVVDLALGGGHAGEVGRGIDAGFALQPRDGVMGTLARRAAGAVGHRKKLRFERCQLCADTTQFFNSLRGLRREELYRNFRFH